MINPMNPRDPRSRTWLSGYLVGVVVGIVGLTWHPPLWTTILLGLIGAIGWGVYGQNLWDWFQERTNPTTTVAESRVSALMRREHELSRDLADVGADLFRIGEVHEARHLLAALEVGNTMACDETCPLHHHSPIVTIRTD